MDIDEKKVLLQEQIGKTLLILDEIKTFYSHLKDQEIRGWDFGGNASLEGWSCFE